MKAAVCPGCGADLVFKDPGAIVRVCEYCNSVVARGDLTHENLGKIGDVADSRSPLAVDLEGAYQGARFTLTGRVVLAHAAGGAWEEWYAHFADGRWGWLAEAQGRFFMTFETSAAAPPFDTLAVGGPAEVAGARFTVAERGEARYRAAAGEIPFRLDPGEPFRYADLSAPGGGFATVDYGKRASEGEEARDFERGAAERGGAPSPSERANPEIPLGRLFRVRRGVATGANAFFVLGRAEARRLALPRECLVRCVASPRDPSPRWLFRPRRLAGAALDYVRSGEQAGLPQRYLCRTRDPWWRVEHVPPAPILVGYMARRRVSVMANDGAVHLNLFHGIYPRDGTPPALVDALLDYLGSPPGQAALLSRARVYAGGLHKLEPRDLEDVPLPDAFRR